MPIAVMKTVITESRLDSSNRNLLFKIIVMALYFLASGLGGEEDRSKHLPLLS